jgi:hypothetical protein
MAMQSLVSQPTRDYAAEAMRAIDVTPNRAPERGAGGGYGDTSLPVRVGILERGVQALDDNFREHKELIRSDIKEIKGTIQSIDVKVDQVKDDISKKLAAEVKPVIEHTVWLDILRWILAAIGAVVIGAIAAKWKS